MVSPKVHGFDFHMNRIIVLPQYNTGDADDDDYDVDYVDGEKFTLRIFCRRGSG